MNKAEYLIELEKRRRQIPPSDERMRLSLEIRERVRHLDDFDDEELGLYVEYLTNSASLSIGERGRIDKRYAEAVRNYRAAKNGYKS